jgi:hypothetical protein
MSTLTDETEKDFALRTVEEKIIESLRSKIDVSTVINGDNYMEWLV